MTRISDMDIDALARVVTAYERELAAMKQRQLVGGDLVKLFRIKEEFVIDESGGLLRRFRIKFTPSSGGRSGIAFRIVVIQPWVNFHNQTILTDRTMAFRRRKSVGGVQHWDNTMELFDGGAETRRVKVYAFTTSDGELSMEYL